MECPRCGRSGPASKVSANAVARWNQTVRPARRFAKANQPLTVAAVVSQFFALADWLDSPKSPCISFGKLPAGSVLRDLARELEKLYNDGN